MTSAQHAILAYVISFCVLGGYAIWLWVKWRRLSRRPFAKDE